MRPPTARRYGSRPDQECIRLAAEVSRPGQPALCDLGGDETYGSTCHHLARSVDTGNIIDVARFTIAQGETASMLRLHVGAFCLAQFQRILTDYVIPGNPLPVSPERWGDRLYKQAEINAWLERMRREMPNHPCLK